MSDQGAQPAQAQSLGGVTRVSIPSGETGSMPPGQTETGAKPAWLPDKFFKDGKPDYEGLSKSYAELERGRSSNQNQPQTPEPQPSPGGTAPQPVVIPGITAEKSVKFSQELQKDGKLSQQSYDDLKAAGYQKDMVDAYIQGQLAVHARGQDAAVAMGNRIKADFGGDEGYGKMIEWATANLTPAEINAFNGVISSNDEGQIRLAIGAVHGKYVAANGREGSFLGGRQSGPASGDVYQNNVQLIEDMKSPRYKKDPAFRDAVMAKMARSKIINRKDL